MEFKQELPIWNAEGVKPPKTHIDQGWQVGDKPPADWFNWLQNRTYKSIEELRAACKQLGVDIENIDFSDIDTALADIKKDLALKATKSYVDTQLGLKANTTYVDSQLKLKVDTSKFNTEVSRLDKELDAVKQSGLNGKNLLETSVKSKGGKVSKVGEVATFDELDKGIKSIETDPSGGTTAVAGDLLSGKTAYSNKRKLVGTMPNRGTLNKHIDTKGQSVTISPGYYSGGKVTAKVGDYNAGDTIASDKLESVSSNSIKNISVKYVHSDIIRDKFVTNRHIYLISNEFITKLDSLGKLIWEVPTGSISFPKDIIFVDEKHNNLVVRTTNSFHLINSMTGNYKAEVRMISGSSGYIKPGDSAYNDDGVFYLVSDTRYADLRDKNGILIASNLTAQPEATSGSYGRIGSGLFFNNDKNIRFIDGRQKYTDYTIDGSKVRVGELFYEVNDPPGKFKVGNKYHYLIKDYYEEANIIYLDNNLNEIKKIYLPHANIARGSSDNVYLTSEFNYSSGEVNAVRGNWKVDNLGEVHSLDRRDLPVNKNVLYMSDKLYAFHSSQNLEIGYIEQGSYKLK